MVELGQRRRSVGFLDHEGETWACFLVASAAHGGGWSGFLSFRPEDGEAEQDEIRTADIFIEDSEAEIHEKARGLGRPLLNGLLASALHKSRKSGAGRSRLRRQFRDLLVGNAMELAAAWEEGNTGDVRDGSLRSLYASYRMDQVAHFISLVEADDFVEAVDRILDGEEVDFRTSDRIQFAMMVVEFVERRIPLPPYEVWVDDFLANPETYRLYAHTLHREGRLP